MAGVAAAAADEEGAEGGFCQKSRGHIVRKVAVGGHTVHFSDLVSSNGVDLFAQEWRKDHQVTQKSGAKQIILIAMKLVLAVGAEPLRTAEKKLRNARVRMAEVGTAFAFQEKRCG